MWCGKIINSSSFRKHFRSLTCEKERSQLIVHLHAIGYYNYVPRTELPIRPNPLLTQATEPRRNPTRQTRTSPKAQTEPIKRERPKRSTEPFNKECPICTSVCEDVVTTPCNHAFCNDCLNDWLSTSNKCPMCRRAISWYKRGLQTFDVDASQSAHHLPSLLGMDEESPLMFHRSLHCHLCYMEEGNHQTLTCVECGTEWVHARCLMHLEDYTFDYTCTDCAPLEWCHHMVIINYKNHSLFGNQGTISPDRGEWGGGL